MRPLQETLALASTDGRVCPRLPAWQRLFEQLPGRRNDGYGSIPAAPLPPDLWAATSDEDKRLRFIEHLEWARAHGGLDAVHAFLVALDETQWHHVGDESL